MKPLAIVTIGALLACIPTHVSAQSPQAFHITESASGLTTDIPDSTVTGTQDHWTITLSGIFQFTGSGTFQLSDPEGNLWNTISRTATTLTFDSDVAFAPNAFNHLSSPFTDTFGIAEQIPNSPGNVIPHSLTFSDLADPATTTPEGSPTALLLGLTALGVCGVARLQVHRP